MGHFLAVSFLMLGLSMVSGCGGCSNDEVAKKDESKKDNTKKDKDKDKKKEEEEKKKKKKPPPPFEFVKPVFNVQPSDESISRRAVKPGHWVTVTHHIKSNAANFYGELESSTLDRHQQSIAIENTQYNLLMSRPVALPKGEVKHIDATYFVPRQQDKENQQIVLHHPFKTRGGASLTSNTLPDRSPAIRMPAYQFFFVVLSSNPDRYNFLKALPSVRAPAAHLNTDHLQFYRVVLPKFQSGQAPLSSDALQWTTIAYLLWDKFDPATLRSDQQSALLDWLHWGGQIIVSGPGSLDLLRGSFLDPYLPATKSRAIEFTAADIRDLTDHWSLRAYRKPDFQTELTLPDDRSLTGIVMDLRNGSTYLPNTGWLVAERQVGRGRIVATAFPLADRAIVGWGNFDGFFNGCLLRRPSRQFSTSEFGVSVTWNKHSLLAPDPLLASTVRFFSRDMRPMEDPVEQAADRFETETWDPNTAEMPAGPTRLGRNYEDRWADKSELPSPYKAHQGQNTDVDDWHFGGFWFWPDSGVGGWNDKSGVADAARQTLKEAAGIVPPARDDVLMLLAVYLAVLVPINWFLFRLIGRVELAWLMMPVIAVVGGVVVVWRAQLDIGFVRSRTEVAVLEMHGDYSRAHLSRYTALYSSLSTSFDFTFDDENVQAQPFALRADHQPIRDPDEEVDTLHFRRDRNVSLQGYQVKSNSTGILHSEQMVDLGGAIRLQSNQQGARVVNESRLVLNDVGVVRRTDNGVELAWIGKLESGSSKPLQFRQSSGNKLRCDEWNQSPAMMSFEVEARQLMRQYDANTDKRLDEVEAEKVPRIKEFLTQADGRRLSRSADERDDSIGVDGRLSLRELELCCMLARDGKVGLGRFLDLTVERLRLGPGEVRLIGWSEQDLGGISISPDVTQTSTQMFVVVHLRPTELPLAQPDTNHIAEFDTERTGGVLNVLPEN